MNVPINFCILDDRDKKQLGQATASGYKKSEIKKELNKSILKSDIVKTCDLSAELLASGCGNMIWDIILEISSNYINNPKIFSWLLFNYQKYKKIENLFIKKIEIRNNQEIRNIIADVSVILCMHDKDKKRFKSLPVVYDDDFLNKNISKNIVMKDFIIGYHMSDYDQTEVKIAINEIAFYLKKKNTPLRNAIYWYLWLIKLEKFKKKNKINFDCKERKIDNISSKHSKDWIWLLWIVILDVAKEKNNKIILQEISSIFLLFVLDYKAGSKTSRKNLIFNAMYIIKEKCDWNKPLVKKYSVRIQACANINSIYRDILLNIIRNSQNDSQHYELIYKTLKDSVIKINKKLLDSEKTKERMEYLHNFVPKKYHDNIIHYFT